MRGYGSHWFSHKMNNRHPLQLKKIKINPGRQEPSVFGNSIIDLAYNGFCPLAVLSCVLLRLVQASARNGSLFISRVLLHLIPGCLEAFDKTTTRDKNTCHALPCYK